MDRTTDNIASILMAMVGQVAVIPLILAGLGLLLTAPSPWNLLGLFPLAFGVLFEVYIVRTTWELWR